MYSNSFLIVADVGLIKKKIIAFMHENNNLSKSSLGNLTLS